MSEGAPAIELSGLTKRYAGRAVVDRLDLRIEHGEILALLGPNGAGKTTTVEIIEGYRRPDEGSVRVLERDPRRDRDELHGRLGIMLQSADLWNQARVEECLGLFGAFYRNPLPTGELLERVGLGARRADRYRSLSGGERQRLALALALVGRPELAILDEPTAAMDVTARHLTWEMLRELRSAGATIVLTTHLLDEAQALADRVAIIDHGRLVAIGSPTELQADLAGRGPGGRTVRLTLGAPLDETDRAALATLSSIKDLAEERVGLYRLTTDRPGPLLVEVSGWLLARGLEPLSIDLGAANLEEVFTRLTGDGASSEASDGPATEGPGSPAGGPT
jgi:ABC-2 type transport system ATP-binding protein